MHTAIQHGMHWYEGVGCTTVAHQPGPAALSSNACTAQPGHVHLAVVGKCVCVTASHCAFGLSPICCSGCCFGGALTADCSVAPAGRCRYCYGERPGWQGTAQHHKSVPTHTETVTLVIFIVIIRFTAPEWCGTSAGQLSSSHREPG
jgi:hypothetical protein